MDKGQAVITRLDVLNAIWEAYARDLGFSSEAFIDNNGVWTVEEESNDEHSRYIKLRTATAEESKFEDALYIIEELFCTPKYNEPMEFKK